MLVQEIVRFRRIKSDVRGKERGRGGDEGRKRMGVIWVWLAKVDVEEEGGVKAANKHSRMKKISRTQPLTTHAGVVVVVCCQ